MFIDQEHFRFGSLLKQTLRNLKSTKKPQNLENCSQNIFQLIKPSLKQDSF